MVDNASTPGIQQAGDVEWHRLELYSPKSNMKINLIGSFFDLTIYEDLFSPILTGYVGVSENYNFITMLPITGEELLYVEFSTPGGPKISLVLAITKIGLRVDDEKKNSYILDFISIEGKLDLTQRISRVFAGNTAELAVSVFEKSFKKSFLDIDKADNNVKFISPYWGPLKIISHIAAKALFPNKDLTTPNYVFFETNKGHKFKSLSTLISSEKRNTLYWDLNPGRLKEDDGKSVRNLNREYQTIQGLRFVSSQDFVTNTIHGALNHRVFSYDLHNKRAAVKNYNFTNDFNKTVHTDKNPLIRDSVSISSGLITIANICPNLFNGINDIADEIYAKRLSLLSQLETYKLDIVVHGISTYEVGDTVEIWLRKATSTDETDKQEDKYDKIYSGRYLITAIQHRLVQARYLCNMQVIKDSSFTEITTK